MKKVSSNKVSDDVSDRAIRSIKANEALLYGLKAKNNLAIEPVLSDSSSARALSKPKFPATVRSNPYKHPLPLEKNSKKKMGTLLHKHAALVQQENMYSSNLTVKPVGQKSVETFKSSTKTGVELNTFLTKSQLSDALNSAQF